MEALKQLSFLLMILSNSMTQVAEAKTIEYVAPRIVAEVTAYTADPLETDSSPDVTANGESVYVGGLACPRKYPFGQKFLIEGKEYTCNDRMAARYEGEREHFDLFFLDKTEALEFGRRVAEVEKL